MPTLQEILAAKKKTAEAKVETKPEPKSKPDILEKSSPLAKIITEKKTGKPFAEKITSDLNLPPEPNIDASPAEFLRYQLDKLNAIVEASGPSKDTLKEIHSNLKTNPDLEELLLPEDLGSITKAMQALTQTTHVKKQKEKTKRISNKVAKENAVDKVANKLGGLF